MCDRFQCQCYVNHHGLATRRQLISYCSDTLLDMLANRQTVSPTGTGYFSTEYRLTMGILLGVPLVIIGYT